MRSRGRVYITAELCGVDVFKEIAARAVVSNRTFLEQEHGRERQRGFKGVARGAKREHLRGKLLYTLAEYAIERRAVVQRSTACHRSKIYLLDAVFFRGAEAVLARKLGGSVRRGLVIDMGHKHFRVQRGDLLRDKR
ncbi:hypothetical protein SDC9_195879 [bioreactor metagenome]|uniref:Uncharacterized protein n=1 Tax=bioreactor metagenome TaxID=1076179 RepID=A0A645ILS6_9ZZZZ